MKKQIIATILLGLTFLPMEAQRLTVRKGTVELGNVTFKQPVTAEFELRNRSLRKLKINNVVVSCGCTKVEYPQGDINAGEKFTMKLTYDAKQMGHFEKAAYIYSNGSKRPVHLTMRGVVVEESDNYADKYPYTFGNLVTDKKELEFDDVNKGDMPFIEMHIRNVGTKLLQPNLMHLPPFITSTVTPAYLRPGHSGKIVVAINSDRLRDYGLTQTSIYLANNPGDKVSEGNEIPVSTVLLPDFDSMTKEQIENAPQASLSADSLDLVFNGKKKAKGEIKITNNGKSTLNISSIQMSTNGLKLTLEKQDIAVGETASLKVTGFRDELLKAQVKPRVLMITNDPKKAKVVIEINVK